MSEPAVLCRRLSVELRLAVCDSRRFLLPVLLPCCAVQKPAGQHQSRDRWCMFKQRPGMSNSNGRSVGDMAFNLSTSASQALRSALGFRLLTRLMPAPSGGVSVPGLLPLRGLLPDGCRW